MTIPRLRDTETTRASTRTTEPHEAYARSAGYTLSQADAPNLLLLLHGLGGDRHQPLKLTVGLERSDLAILAPDARAHGDTTVIGDSADFELDGMAADVAALLDLLRQAGKPTYLAGISMGAAMALRLALGIDPDTQQPLIQHLAGVALIRPAFSDQPYPDNLEPLHLIGDLLATDPAGEQTFRQSKQLSDVAAVSTSGAASLLEQFTKPHAVARSIRLREIPRNTAWNTNELGQLKTPTLVLGAPRDPVHPVALARRLAGLIANATYRELPSRDEQPQPHEAATRSAVQHHLSTRIPPQAYPQSLHRRPQ